MSDPPRTSERLLIAATTAAAGVRIVCTSLGRGQLAAYLAALSPQAHVDCHFLDRYLADQAKEACRDLPNLQIACTADLPPAECDLAALPLSMSGDGELTRELLQQAHQRLDIGGRLLTATDHPSDTWLHQELQALFAKVTRTTHEEGVVYSAIKTAPPKKMRTFACELVFRDNGRLLRGFTRPGVFSHRRVDPGARAVMETMQLGPDERVFDIGCGWGALSLAAAARGDNVHVYAVDSNPRAIECTQRSAELNALTAITAVLDCHAACDAPGTYDVALANPPYYSHFRIAGIFVRGAAQALRPGGRLYLVTRRPQYYEDSLPPDFQEIRAVEQRGYFVISARRSG